MKSRVIISAVIFVLVLALSFSSVLAEVPQMISYQSKLTTPSGALVDTTIQITFTIYNDSTSGSVLWTESQDTVVVENGIYSVLLGSKNPIPDTVFNGDVRYLGVQVGTDPEMTPRKTIASVAYAFQAGTVSNGGSTGSGWVDDSTVVRLETITDSVGIGTTTPSEKLDVAGTAQVSGFKMPTGATNGHVLTSDANGVGTWQAVPPGNGGGHTGAIYRWNSWSTWSQWKSAWFMNNNSLLFGGISPQVWGDNYGIAGDMSDNMEVLRTLFTRKGYGGKNATVVADEWKSYSSTNSRHTAVLFRVNNTTGGDIVWTLKFWYTCYNSWQERASVALNGTGVWNSGSQNNMSTTSVALTIPGGQTSTVIVISASAGSNPTNGMRTNVLAFFDDCLELPAGLEYVDDLDTAQ